MQATQPSAPTPHISRRKTYLAMGGIALVLIIGFIVWKVWQRPAVGTLRYPEPRLDGMNGEDKAYQQFEGEHITFSLPGDYTLNVHTSGPAPLQEQILFTQNKMLSKKVAVTVEERVTEGLEGSPSFKLRTVKTDKYAREDIVWGEHQGSLFCSHGASGRECAVFFKHGTQVVSLALTSPESDRDAAVAELRAIVESIRWP